MLLREFGYFTCIYCDQIVSRTKKKKQGKQGRYNFASMAIYCHTLNREIIEDFQIIPYADAALSP